MHGKMLGFVHETCRPGRGLERPSGAAYARLHSGSMFDFSLHATDGPARAGTFTTPHGDVPTPAFMPVGTATVARTAITVTASMSST